MKLIVLTILGYSSLRYSSMYVYKHLSCVCMCVYYDCACVSMCMCVHGFVFTHIYFVSLCVVLCVLNFEYTRGTIVC